MRDLTEFMDEREIFTLENHPSMTYKEIGEKFGVTQGRVRQVKARAERKLREEKRREQAEERGQLPITITLRRKDLWVIIRGLQKYQNILMRDYSDQRKKNHEPDEDIKHSEMLIHMMYNELQKEG